MPRKMPEKRIPPRKPTIEASRRNASPKFREILESDKIAEKNFRRRILLLEMQPKEAEAIFWEISEGRITPETGKGVERLRILSVDGREVFVRPEAYYSAGEVSSLTGFSETLIYYRLGKKEKAGRERWIKGDVVIDWIEEGRQRFVIRKGREGKEKEWLSLKEISASTPIKHHDLRRWISETILREYAAYDGREWFINKQGIEILLEADAFKDNYYTLGRAAEELGVAKYTVRLWRDEQLFKAEKHPFDTQSEFISRDFIDSISKTILKKKVSEKGTAFTTLKAKYDKKKLAKNEIGQPFKSTDLRRAVFVDRKRGVVAFYDKKGKCIGCRKMFSWEIKAVEKDRPFREVFHWPAMGKST